MSSFRTRSTCVLAPCTSVSQWPVLAVRTMHCCSCLVSQQLVRSFGEAAASQPTAPVLRSRLIDAVALRKKVGAAAGSALPMYYAGISTCCVAPRNVGLRCLSLTLGTACVSEYSALPCPTSSIDMARSGRRALSTGTPRLSCLARPQTPSSTRVAEQTRRLCSAAEHDQNVRISNAYFLLGLKPGVTKKAAKMRYYELAKQAHPDVLNGAKARAAPDDTAPVVKDAQVGLIDDSDEPASAVKFHELQEAFEAVMEDVESGGGGGTRAQKPSRRPARRQKTLGEVLCERVSDEPEAVREVWAELRANKLAVNGQMLDAILKACAKNGEQGMHIALAILEQGTEDEIIAQQVRTSGFVTLLGMSSTRDDWDVDTILNDITDEDRESPEVIAAVGAVFCAGTRSSF